MYVLLSVSLLEYVDSLLDMLHLPSCIPLLVLLGLRQFYGVLFLFVFMLFRFLYYCRHVGYRLFMVSFSSSLVLAITIMRL